VTPSLVVDPVACAAYGYCAELLPERVRLDEWGYPVVDGRPLPPELARRARAAVRACPRRALRLRSVDAASVTLGAGPSGRRRRSD